MKTLSDADRAAIEELTLDESCEPSYDLIKACLVWPDERPERISNAGYEVLCDLWIVRSFVHKGLPRDEWGLDPHHFEAVWADALSSGLRWPGFARMELSTTERRVLEQGDAEASMVADPEDPDRKDPDRG